MISVRANGKSKLVSETRQEQRKMILAALSKATSDGQQTPCALDVPDSEDNGYYTLTQEEMTALINGDIEIIEGWVSNLDRSHATWLLMWLIKESR